MADYSNTLVSVNIKFVKNLGDFQSLHVEMGCTDQPRGEENAEQAMNRVRDFVERKLDEHMDKVEADLEKVAGK